jgi:inosose dehydratase
MELDNADINRRKFLGLGSLAILGTLGFADALAAKSKIKLAYSAITWSGNDLVAIKEISDLGFKGIQLRANTYPIFKDNPNDLKDILEKHKLQLPMFSSGNISLNGDIKKDIETHVNHAKFIKNFGGKCLQFTNNSRPKDRNPSLEELKKYASNMSEVAKAVKEETGLQVAYHNHMHQLGETPEEVEVIFTEMNHKYILAELDVAHYQQGGGKPAEAVLKYQDILYALHIKDTKPTNSSSGYQFVELGQGTVDFPAIFKNLEKIKFNKWAIVELDAVPVKGKTALDCAKTSSAYLKTLNLM